MRKSLNIINLQNRIIIKVRKFIYGKYIFSNNIEIFVLKWVNPDIFDKLRNIILPL